MHVRQADDANSWSGFLIIIHLAQAKKLFKIQFLFSSGPQVPKPQGTMMGWSNRCGIRSGILTRSIKYMVAFDVNIHTLCVKHMNI